MYIITYSLKNNEINSNNYYKIVETFANEVISEAKELLNPIIKGYHSYNKTYSTEESILELLILGTLWRVYSSDAMGLEDIPKNILIEISKVRNLSGKLKPGVDFLKGVLSTLFLSPDLYDNMASINPKLVNFKKLIEWLKATGEFTYEVKKLGGWYGYLCTLAASRAEDIIASAITLAFWFEGSSEEILGAYTENVDRYLNEIRPQRYWREDVIFCGRRRVEYHLNMVGAEIMNKVFRAEFLKTNKKILLLPACMKLQKESKCQAKSTGEIIKCSKCSRECQVNMLVELGEKSGFEVYIVPHESSISANSKNNNLFDSNTGVIGVACVLNLIAGGWKLQEMGIPAQCVLLDYCGCKTHWHSEGIPTNINIEKLKKIFY